MAKRNRMSVLKRQREVRKAEKAALKRERREQRKTGEAGNPEGDDMAGYFDEANEEEAEPEEESPPSP